MTDAAGGEEVRLAGQIAAIRDLGRIVFLVLRDSTGEVQLVARGSQILTGCRRLQIGYTVSIDGCLQSRQRRDINPHHPAGNIEIQIASLRLLANTADNPEAPAFHERRVQTAIRGLLESHGFIDIGEELTTPAGARLERAYRIRETPIAEHTVTAACRRTTLVELQLAFATLDDLSSVVEDIAGVSGESRPVAIVWDGAHQLKDCPFNSGQPFTMFVGLPITGHSLVAGRDAVLVALAMPAEGTDDDPVAQCLVLLAGPRVVGVGAVQMTGNGSLPAGPIDPLVFSEIMDWNATAAQTIPPAGAWFSLDIARMAEGLDDPNPLNPIQAGQDLASLLRVARTVGTAPIDLTDLEFGAERIERWDVEASAAMARSRSASIAHSFDELLNDFAMDDDVCSQLFALFPEVGQRMQRWPEGERFEWIWSILGSEATRDILRDPNTRKLLQLAIELRIVTEPRHITYVDARSLESLGETLATYPTDGPSSVLPLLRHVLANSPASFTHLIEALAIGGKSAVEHVTQVMIGHGPQLLHEAAERWLAAPTLLPIVLRASQKGTPLSSVAEVVQTIGERLLPNRPIDPHDLKASLISLSKTKVPELLDVISELDSSELLIDVASFVFRPVSLTYSQTRNTLRLTESCTHHVSTSRLSPGGQHWSRSRQCYSFGVPGSAAGGIRLYLSKNSSSALAKASVGICTAGDLSLYRRTDHHHLNVVDADHGVVIGNAQLHVLTIHDRPALMVRAVNVSTAALASGAARWLVESTLWASVELAAHSGIQEVHLGEGLCFWHLDSSRPQIRALLDSIRQQLPCHHLDDPFYLFRFGKVDVQITKTYRLWAADNPEDQPKLHDLLKVAI